MKQKSFATMIDSMSSDVWQNLRQAVETGRWPDGRRLTDEQRELSLQAVIAWEIKHGIPEHERTGYLERKCASQQDQTVIIRDQE